MSYTDEEKLHVLDQMKILLLKDNNSVFITTVCFQLRHLWDDRKTIDLGGDHAQKMTACTDGRSITYGTDFIMKLAPMDRVAVMLHETWHVIFNHCSGLSRFTEDQIDDLNLWNMACDFVINLMLVKSGHKFLSKPEYCYDTKYEGFTSEEVYLDLKKNPLPLPQPGGLGNDLRLPPDTKEKYKEFLDDILITAAVQSHRAGEDIGKLPGNLQVMLDKLLNPKMPWPVLLQRFLVHKAKNEYSFTRPNRRFFPKYHLPSAYSEAAGNVVAAFDMSCSVGHTETTQHMSDVVSIFKTIKMKSFTVLQWDTRIVTEDNVTSMNELMNINFQGRGGTDVECVMEWAAKKKPDLLIIFTDGGLHKPPNLNPKLPILWMVHDYPSFTVPDGYGKVIHYSMRDTKSDAF